MAATCLEIVTDALKLARIIASGENPTTAEQTDGMNSLQSFYDGLVFGGMFGELEDVYLEENDTAEAGKRYFVPTGITLTVPTSVYVDANGDIRQPYDLSLYESLTQAGTRNVKLYDRTEWVELTGLALTSTAPLSIRGRHGLAAAFAISPAYAAMFGDIGNPDLRRAGQMFMGRLMQPASTQEARTADYF